MGLRPEIYQHPLDRESLLNLQAIKWFERLSKYLVADDLEQDFYLLNMLDNVVMTRKDFPRVLDHLEAACNKLNMPVTPRVFLDTNPAPHVLSIGERQPMIVLSSELLDLLSDDELAAAIAHEVGHIACGHAYYKLLAENFSGLAQLANVVPGLGMAAFTLKLPLYDWYRKADLSADRAAVLVTGQPNAVLRMIGKVAGGTRSLASQISLESLVAQAEQTRGIIQQMQTGSLRQKTAYFFSNLVMQGMLRTQPWPALRVLELQTWIASPGYEAALQGQPPPVEPSPAAVEHETSIGAYIWNMAEMAGDVGRTLWPWGGKSAVSPSPPDSSSGPPERHADETADGVQ